MANYIDGFVLPIPREHLDEYQRVVQAVGEVWKEHGALSYQEYVGDDMNLDGVRSFTDSAGAAGDEVIIFGWVTFESREARDAANEKVASDPRMEALVGAADTGFDPGRMAYAGFRPLVRV